MKKIKHLSIQERMDELDKLTNEESDELVGGYPISYTGGSNTTYRTTVDVSPGDSGGGSVGIGRNF